MTKTEKSILLSLIFFLFVGSALYIYKQQSAQTDFQVIQAKPSNPEEKSHTETLSLEPKKVDLNQASAVDFDRLPTVGPALARAIVDYRKQAGPFKKVEDILNVPGFGKGRYKKVWETLQIDGQKGIHPSYLFQEKFVRTKKSAPKIKKEQASFSPKEEYVGEKIIDINKASMDQLMTLPRIGKKLAARILQHRETYGAFLVKEELFEVDGMTDSLFEKIEPYIEVK